MGTVVRCTCISSFLVVIANTWGGYPPSFSILGNWGLGKLSDLPVVRQLTSSRPKARLSILTLATSGYLIWNIRNLRDCTHLPSHHLLDSLCASHSLDAPYKVQVQDICIYWTLGMEWATPLDRAASSPYLDRSQNVIPWSCLPTASPDKTS